MLERPASRPAASFGEAVARARAFMALDDASILPEAHTALLADAPADLAVVLLHGFTNHPGQFREFAPMVRAKGANVFIPRLPEHGDVDRLTTRLKHLTAEAWLASATEAIDIACGLGKRVAVLGISTSGLLCAYAVQYRSDVWRSVPVSPFFALLQLPHGVSSSIGALLRWVPNMFLWWDPRVKAKQRPRTAYPRFSTRALGQALRISDLVYRDADREKALAQQAYTIVNRADPAVNNAVSAEVSRDWHGLRGYGVAYRELRNLPTNHDIIEPDNPLARTDLVYPILLDALFSEELPT
jgi:alpha-beta hydrolase superfamily lysophospholipase